MIKGISKVINGFIDIISIGFNKICLIFSKGLFFYFYAFFSLLHKIFRFKFLTGIMKFFRRLQNSSTAFVSIVMIFVFGLFFYNNIYIHDDVMTKVVDDDTGIIQSREAEDTHKELYQEKDDLNLYRKYAKYNINNIDFSELKAINNDVVAWISVDNTNVNYPVVQSNDNDYYLRHDINKSVTDNGWIFMDFRNTFDMSNQNTIFYGHNLLNKTAFGSLSNLFTEKWFNNSNHKIRIRNEYNIYTYEVFSLYYIDPESYYLQISFGDDEYKKFLDTLVSRSLYNFNISLDNNDKIITLSTCTDDNKNRKVVHAKRID